ncbi:PREDICTED: uncharacterized protein LOC109188372 isoform X2 [Ipomoea nil]|uniref:uncharacterized protein LOC109188372 isoform X2 n=1 Tax=Ipomoea nil TaxID=35883 RepID=UPI000901E793|nr:PREDICTED: uncharacterized protein LOC109188372 isoform X2 [Ipomoea nil]
MKKSALPPALVSNLQDVLQRRKGGDAGGGGNEDQQPKSDKEDSTEPSPSNSGDVIPEPDSSKPIVLVTNADGIDSPGLACLLDALVRQGLYNVYFCAPQLDKSVSGHSITLRETVAVGSVEIQGATGYEVSGTPVDCISLVLSGALYSWSKPLVVISGIDRGSSCGLHGFYSGVVAGAREALLCGIPSISISLNWKKDESQESDFKDAASVCLPLITAAIRDIEKGAFPKGCLMNVEVPTSPLANKGFKLAKQSLWKSTLNWNAIPANRNPGGRFHSSHHGLGIQLAQLGRDASAAGAARRLATQKKDIEEVESVGISGKSDPNRKVKYFRLELLDKQIADKDEDLDFRALENGFVRLNIHSFHIAIFSSHMLNR